MQRPPFIGWKSFGTYKRCLVLDLQLMLSIFDVATVSIMSSMEDIEDVRMEDEP